MATSFESLVQRAEKRAKGRRTPFVITVEDDEDICIEYPDAIQAMDYERAQTAYEQLQVLTKADFPRILDLVRGKPISVVQLLLTEMWAHWGDDSSEAPGGKEL